MKMHVVAACVLIEMNGQVLAVERRDMPGKYGLPGGKREEFERPCEAAARELWEETGLLVHPLRDLTLIFTRQEAVGLVEVFRAAPRWRGKVRQGDAGRVDFVPWKTLFEGPFGHYNKALYDSIQVGLNEQR
jgi:8-oxo-dGTP pyrophosphatase MutT (NUDIX family)